MTDEPAETLTRGQAEDLVSRLLNAREAMDYAYARQEIVARLSALSEAQQEIERLKAEALSNRKAAEQHYAESERLRGELEQAQGRIKRLLQTGSETDIRHASERDRLAAEKAALEEHIERLQSSARVLTCVYCGQAYPPGTPNSGVPVLTEHIKVCPKHPMRAAESALAAAQEKLECCSGDPLCMKCIRCLTAQRDGALDALKDANDLRKQHKAALAAAQEKLAALEGALDGLIATVYGGSPAATLRAFNEAKRARAQQPAAGEGEQERPRDTAGYGCSTGQGSIGELFNAFVRLQREGWRDGRYAPKDGSEIEIIELGSTGIHRARWVECSFWIDGDYPSEPALWRPLVKPEDAPPAPREPEPEEERKR